MSKQTAGYVHPLLRAPIDTAATSSMELLEKWTNAMAKEIPDASDLESLLFRVPSFHSVELTLLCLDIADGHLTSESDFRLEGETYSYDCDPGKLRLQVAQKAYWALCEGLFKSKKDRHSFYPSWATLVTEERVFKKILWFIFDSDRRRSRRLKNLRAGSHFENNRQDNIFRKFVVDLVLFAWDFNGLNDRGFDERDKIAHAMFHAARPELIRILHRVGKLEKLKRLAPLTSDISRARGLSGKERRVLRELAIEQDLPDSSGKGLWQVIEAKVAEGNKAAEFLWCYLPRLKAVRRELSLKRAENQRFQAEQREEERARLEREREKAEERLEALS